jgi:hypothetical protein
LFRASTFRRSARSFSARASLSSVSVGLLSLQMMGARSSMNGARLNPSSAGPTVRYHPGAQIWVSITVEACLHALFGVASGRRQFPVDFAFGDDKLLVVAVDVSGLLGQEDRPLATGAVVQRAEGSLVDGVVEAPVADVSC